MLRDFGLVTLIDLSVSLAGVLLVLPAALALAERGQVLTHILGTGRRAAARLPRPRRPKAKRVAGAPGAAGASPRRAA